MSNLFSASGALVIDGTLAASNLSGTNTGNVTIGTANGLSVVGQAVSLATAIAGGANGALLGTDKTKLDALSGTNTGDQTTITGNAGTATALQTARSINGVSFNGTADITVADATKVAISGTETITGAKTFSAMLSASANISLTGTGAVNYIVGSTPDAVTGPLIPCVGIIPAANPTIGDAIFGVGNSVGVMSFLVRYSGSVHSVGDFTTGTSGDVLGGRLISSASASGTNSFKSLDGGRWNLSTADASAYLARNAANVINTPGKLTATTGLGVGNSAAATTLGTVVKKVEIFDSTGTSLGFLPIYDAIT